MRINSGHLALITVAACAIAPASALAAIPPQYGDAQRERRGPLYQGLQPELRERRLLRERRRLRSTDHLPVVANRDRQA